MTATALQRVIISVSDLERALAFYRDVLGLVPGTGVPGFARMPIPGGVELMLHERPSTPGPAGVAPSFAVPDVDATTAAALTAGCTVLDEPGDQPWGERQSVLADPDGHVVCLVGPVSAAG
ncbi:VOC family protein [Pseudonocardia sp. GCM10023141]|uniref:VOC family protein n=1 Tax=Pseudonocardia sp. GCM10023141 TaxID=3252653 RepID=UPI00360A655B